MSQESQDALVDLLMSMSMSLSSEPEEKPLSEHDRKRRKKQFIRNLVQEHERKQLRRKFGSSGSTADSGKESGSKTTASAAVSGGPTKPKSSNTNEKVRIELVEAIFKVTEKKDNKKEKKDKKAKKDKKTSSDPNKFKEGTKKVIVLPRSTTSKEVLKLAASKLKMKKPVRVFLKGDC